MKKGKILILVSSILAVIVLSGLLLPLSLILYANNYMNTNTWATITAIGKFESDTSDDFRDTQEYLQGDTINVGEVILEIRDITHEGVVTIEVQEGNLYDNNGVVVDTFIINKGEPTIFRMDNGSVTLSVDSNKYR